MGREGDGPPGTHRDDTAPELATERVELEPDLLAELALRSALPAQERALDPAANAALAKKLGVSGIAPAATEVSRPPFPVEEESVTTDQRALTAEERGESSAGLFGDRTIPQQRRPEAGSSPRRSSTTFGAYGLLGPIEAGEHTEVRLAYRTTGGKRSPCVLKRVREGADAEARARFADEARISMQLQHPNIVEHFDTGEIDGLPYLALELVDGISLRQLEAMSSPDPLPVELVLQVGSAVADALAYAHGLLGSDGEPLGLVHRDVCPQNVLISRAGAVKLGDFGIARYRGRSADTAVGTPRGKIRYISPEQLTGGTVDARADVYMLGVVLTELMTGRALAPGGPLLVGDLEPRIRERFTARSVGASPALIELLIAMTRMAAERRPSSASEVASALRRELGRWPAIEPIAAYVDRVIFGKHPPLEPGDAAIATNRTEREEDGPEGGYPTTTTIALAELERRGASGAVPRAPLGGELSEPASRAERLRALLRDEDYLQDVYSYLESEEAELAQAALSLAPEAGARPRPKVVKGEATVNQRSPRLGAEASGRVRASDSGKARPPADRGGSFGAESETSTADGAVAMSDDEDTVGIERLPSDLPGLVSKEASAPPQAARAPASAPVKGPEPRPAPAGTPGEPRGVRPAAPGSPRPGAPPPTRSETVPLIEIRQRSSSERIALVALLVLIAIASILGYLLYTRHR